MKKNSEQKILSNDSLRALSMSELNDSLLEQRKEQFKLRMNIANGTLDKFHHVGRTRKAVARIKTIMTEKAE